MGAYCNNSLHYEGRLNQGREISIDAEVLGGFSSKQWGGVETPSHERKMATLVLDNGAYNAKIGYSHAHVR